MVGLESSRWAPEDCLTNLQINDPTVVEEPLEGQQNEQNGQSNPPFPSGILNPQAAEFSCSAPEEEACIPMTFKEWSEEEDPLYRLRGHSHMFEDSLDIDVMKYMDYLLWECFPAQYHAAFSNGIERIHAEELANFDFQTTHPSLGFWSFKEWADRTRFWFKNHYPELDDYQLHRLMVVYYTENTLQLCADDYAEFRNLREDRAIITRYRLECAR